MRRAIALRWVFEQPGVGGVEPTLGGRHRDEQQDVLAGPATTPLLVRPRLVVADRQEAIVVRGLVRRLRAFATEPQEASPQNRANFRDHFDGSITFSTVEPTA